MHCGCFGKPESITIWSTILDLGNSNKSPGILIGKIRIMRISQILGMYEDLGFQLYERNSFLNKKIIGSAKATLSIFFGQRSLRCEEIRPKKKKKKDFSAFYVQRNKYHVFFYRILGN